MILRITEYESLRGSAGIIDRTDRGVVRLDGADRRSFLQGILTNDITALGSGGSCYAALLTPQGRMIADMHVLETGEFLLLDVRRDHAASLASRFDGLIFSEDVTVRDASAEYSRIAIAGPHADQVLKHALAVDPRVVTDHFVDSSWDVPLFELFVEPSAVPELRTALSGGGAVEVSREAVEAVRIESGVPLFGVDMDEDTIPLEAGIENRAISFTKGCYVGQEVIIRVLHRGHGRVARKLVRLEIDAPSETDLPPQGAAIVHGDSDIGRLTSVAWSPRLEKGVALGYLRRDFLESHEEPFTAAGIPVRILQ